MNLSKITDYVDFVDPCEDIKYGDFVMDVTEEGSSVCYEYKPKQRFNMELADRVLIMRPKSKAFNWDMADACMTVENIDDIQRIHFDYEEFTKLIEKRNELRKTENSDGLYEAENAVIDCLKIAK